jgi:Sec-independent protein translocase protein TatA
MFGMDFEALVLLAVLAFILFGPEKLPEYAAKAGYYLAKLRKATTELSQQAQCSFPDNLKQPPPAAVAIADQTCPYCAQEVGKDFTFCPQCGHRIKEEAAAPAPPPPPQPLAS